MDYDQLSIIEDLTNYNWININSISFWNIKSTKNKDFTIFKLPITINLTSPNFDILNNYIKYLELDINKNNLYIIKNINYDMVKYNKTQHVTINLETIFYK